MLSACARGFVPDLAGRGSHRVGAEPVSSSCLNVKQTAIEAWNIMPIHQLVQVLMSKFSLELGYGSRACRDLRPSGTGEQFDGLVVLVLSALHD
jgi:hypothetical protein